MVPREPLREGEVRTRTRKCPIGVILLLEKYSDLIDLNLSLLPIDFGTRRIANLGLLNDLMGLAEVVVPCRIQLRPGLLDQNIFSVDILKFDLLDFLEEIRAGLSRTRFNIGNPCEFTIGVWARVHVPDVGKLHIWNVGP